MNRIPFVIGGLCCLLVTGSLIYRDLSSPAISHAAEPLAAQDGIAVDCGSSGDIFSNDSDKEIMLNGTIKAMCSMSSSAVLKLFRFDPQRQPPGFVEVERKEQRYGPDAMDFSFTVPPGGKISLDCEGSGNGNCSYTVSVPETFSSFPTKMGACVPSINQRPVVYRNESNENVDIAIRVTNDCREADDRPSVKPAEITMGNIVQDVESGQSRVSTFTVPPQGEITFTCFGVGGSCSYALFLRPMSDSSHVFSTRERDCDPNLTQNTIYQNKSSGQVLVTVQTMNNCNRVTKTQVLNAGRGVVFEARIQPGQTGTHTWGVPAGGEISAICDGDQGKCALTVAVPSASSETKRVGCGSDDVIFTNSGASAKSATVQYASNCNNKGAARLMVENNNGAPIGMPVTLDEGVVQTLEVPAGLRIRASCSGAGRFGRNCSFTVAAPPSQP